MYRQETIKPYNQEQEKTAQVEEMFNHIAPTYDTLNHRLSWNIDRYWRKKALTALKQHQPQQILDIATGTGDFAIMAAQNLKPGQVVGIDIAEGMLAVGQTKAEKKQLGQIISFRKDDCMALSFANDTFDAVTAAFGIRNFEDLDRGLAEMQRILKPGGHLCVLELTHPVAFPMKQLFSIYSHTILPLYGRIISKDANAYSYLTATIDAFPQGEEMMSILKKAGFRNTAFKRLTGGICTLYLAEK